jgi:hypothetical protein
MTKWLSMTLFCQHAVIEFLVKVNSVADICGQLLSWVQAVWAPAELGDKDF